MSWIRDLINPNARTWEEFYRNRWQHDRVVRSTHGVNCTGSCSWMIYVKDGIVTWEMQATDYPKLEAGLPGYEPRGCPRGIVFSWYIYSPLRIKYPYVRGVLLDAWREARSRHADPVEAWAEVMDNAAARRQYQAARGRGGFRRTSWDESLEIVAASLLYTAKKYGPDRVAGFSPIPAMSMLSYAAGSRFLQLFGAPLLSFYDLYADFPPASPETWGEKTDVAESADWYNSKYIVTTGSNLNMTRTPDVHFVAEARNNGSKLVVLSPDFSEVARYADWWIPVHSGMDAAFWMAVDHVILQEFHAARQVPYFVNYLKSFSDSPFLVALDKSEKGYTAGRFLRAGRLARYAGEENGDWKFLVFDAKTGEPRMPRGAIGSRWQAQKGRWNLELKDDLDGTEIDPVLSLLESRDAELPVTFCGFRQQPDVPAQRSSEVRRDGRWTDRGNYGLRPSHGAIRHPARAGGRLSAGLQRPKCAVHAGLAGEIHGHQPQHRDPICPRVCFHRRENRRQVHRNCRLRREPLVSQQPALPCFHRCLNALRLYRSQWRRVKSLHGPGKACARGVLVDASHGARLDGAAQASEWAFVSLCSQRSVEI